MLDKFNLTTELINKIIAAGLKNGGDFCEIYYEYKRQNIITLIENKVKEAKYHIVQGIGIRVLQGEKIGYAYSDVLDETPLLKAAQAASYIADKKITEPFNSSNISGRQDFSIGYSSPASEDIDKKSEILLKANDATRSYSDKVYQVNCSYSDDHKYIEIANSDGLWKSDEQSVMSFSVQCAVQNGNIRDIGRSFAGGRYAFDFFNTNKPENIGKKAAVQALKKLDAIAAPAGMLPVVIAKGWGGVLVHEAVGHGLESDFHRKKTSLYTGKTGQFVASPLVTIVDDGTVKNGRGTIKIDDEGNETERTVLIENGVLTGLMSDVLNARLMNIKPTGNGRRMSFREYPIPRMTNTFIESGDSNPDDLLKDIKKGIYAAQLGGGQVDITTGNFVFEIGEGYMIESGKITSPIRGANLIGNGPEAMNKVAGVGNDLEIESGTGTCGKDGQNVVVAVGQPTIYLTEITIGGTKS
jgi:TldD protein